MRTDCLDVLRTELPKRCIASAHSNCDQAERVFCGILAGGGAWRANEGVEVRVEVGRSDENEDDDGERVA